MRDSSRSILKSLGIESFQSIEDARAFQKKGVEEYQRSHEYPMDQKAMKVIFEENNRNAVKNPKDSFWTFYFLNSKEINKKMLALGPNLREWSKVAKKNDAEIFMVVDEETLAILKNQSLPADSGMNGNYFDFFKDCGYKFVKVDDLINKLPKEPKKSCTKINNDTNYLIDKGLLAMASKRDFADILVSMSGNKFVMNIEGNGNCRGITFRFEPDIIANSQNAKKIAGDFPMSSSMVDVMAIFVPIDSAGTMPLINAKTAHGESAEIQTRRLNEKYCNDASGCQVQPTVEIAGKRGEDIFTLKAVRDTEKLVKKMREYYDANHNEKIDPDTRAALTREVSLTLKQSMIISTARHKRSSVQASKLGTRGRLSMRSWTIDLGNGFVPLITKESDLSDVIKLIKTPESNSRKELTWKMCEELINKKSAKNIDSNGPGLPTTNPPPSTTNKKLPEKYVAHETCPNPDHAFPSLKKAAALGFSAMSSNISRPSLTSISSRDFAMRQNLNPPSSKPTLNQPLHHQLSTLKQLSDDLGGVGHK